MEEMRIKTTFVAFRHFLSYLLVGFLVYGMFSLNSIFHITLYFAAAMGLIALDQFSLQAVYEATRIPLWPRRAPELVRPAEGTNHPYQVQRGPE